MTAISKREADAWDRVLDAAAALADLIATSGIDINEEALEELTIFLATRADTVRRLLSRPRDNPRTDGKKRRASA